MSLMLLTTGRLLAQQISSFSPAFGSAGEPITINGSGFYPGTLVVRFNGILDTTAVAMSPLLIHAHVPAGATTGPITVQVGVGSASSADDFLVLGLGPYITGFSPAYGSPGDQITITGWHLSNPQSVTFGGVNSTTFMPNGTGSQISAVVPAGAVDGPIAVTTPYGTSNSLGSFTVLGPGPYISGFDPAVGNGGTTVYIEGAHFIGATGAVFNGKAGTGFFVQSDTRIQVTAPPGVTTGPITVTSNKGSFTTRTNFFVPPGISSFSPLTGRAGTNVVITGTNLLGATAVSFGGALATFPPATNNLTLVVSVPVGAISGKLRVTTPAGSATAPNNFLVEPTLFAFTPGSGPPGTGVVLMGANLDEGLSSVKFNGAAAAFGNVSFGQATAIVPAAATTGPIMITTTNGRYTSAMLFFLPPAIASFSPTNSAPGTTVAVRGANFLGTTAVTFSGVAAGFVPPTNNTTLVAVVPPGITTGPLSVFAPGGTATSTAVFYAAPLISGFTPAHGLPGQVVTISGANFEGVSAVAFAGTPAKFTYVSDTTLQATVPSGAAAGPIGVTGPAGVAVSAANFTVDLFSDLGVGLAGSSNPVFVGSNLVYTIAITNAGPFDAPNTVVDDVLPASAILSSNSVSQGAITASGTHVTGALGTLNAARAATLQVVIVPRSVGFITNSVTVSSGYADPNPSNNSASVATLVLPLPLLSIQPYSQSQWRISWPVMLTNYTLEAAATLGPGSQWKNLATLPTIVGTNKFVIEANNGSSQFYRLAK